MVEKEISQPLKRSIDYVLVLRIDKIKATDIINAILVMY